MKPTILAIILVCACLLPAHTFSQCNNPIPDTASCTGTEPVVANNEILGTGTTKWFRGASATYNSLSIQGGKLIVCGELQVNSFSMTTGTLVITRTGRLTVNTGDGSSMVFKGGCEVYNAGYFKIMCNLVLDGPDAWTNPAQANIVWNGPGALFELPFTYFVLEKGNCFFTNKGTANFSGIINSTNSDSASVCLGDMSKMYVMLLENRRRNSYVAPYGTACVFVKSWGFAYQDLTMWPSIFICRSPGYCYSCSNQNWGSASLFNSCASCAGMFLLPVQFTDIRAKPVSSSVELSWSISTLPERSQFIIQRSGDGVSFHNIDSIIGNKTAYRYTDDAAAGGRSYYRIVLSYGEKRIVTQILPVDVGGALHDEPVISPNPFTAECTVTLPRYEFVQQVKLVNAFGNIVHVQAVQKETKSIAIRPAGALPAGEYFVQVITGNSVYNLRVVRR